MPLLDKPIEELLIYQGSSPCPQDIDIFWDNAIEEMKSVDRKTEFKKADFQVPNFECYDLYFTGVGNARIHAKFVKPQNISGKIPALVGFHGYTGSASDWLNLVSFAACGFCVAEMDCRGQGGYSEDVGGVKGNTLSGHIIRGLEDGPEKLLYRQIFLDTAEFADIIMSLSCVNEKEVMSYGASQGGALAIACAALEPRIYKVASIYPFLSDYKRVWDMDLAKDAYYDILEYFRRFDPCHEREEEIFGKLGYIDIQNIAKRIKGKVLMVTARMDYTCPPSTQFAVYNKISSEKNVIFYHDYAHEGLPGVNERIIQFFLKDLSSQ